MKNVPELPEMENYRRILSERIVGQEIQNVQITREKSINVSVDEFINEVKGRTITAIDRRAKHLIFRLDSGRILLLHLMLGGLMYLGDEENDIDRTKQVTLSFANQYLYFIGLRLGYLHLLLPSELEEELSDLGPEPLSPEFSLTLFNELIERRRGALKTTLVNQKFLSGIGNLYSDEICYAAGLLPMRKADELKTEEKASLFHSIQQVLERGISLGGYMDVPVYKGDPLTGNYYDNCYVYDREGEPCNRCGSTIIKTEISSRKSFYCERCQK